MHRTARPLRRTRAAAIGLLAAGLLAAKMLGLAVPSLRRGLVAARDAQRRIRGTRAIQDGVALWTYGSWRSRLTHYFSEWLTINQKIAIRINEQDFRAIWRTSDGKGVIGG